MSAHASIQPERLRAAFARAEERVGDGERRSTLIVGGAFVLAAAALALRAPSVATPSLSLAVLYVLGIAVSAKIRIDLGDGFTVPTQIVFVPMLFALPPALVPLLVLLGLLLAQVPGLVGGRLAPSRLLTVPANCWFAIGPALVLTLAGTTAPDSRPLVLLAALAAQLACDFLASAALERLHNGIGVRELAAEARPSYLIDLALAPLGLAIAIATMDSGDHWVVLLILPLLWMLSWFSSERRARLEQLIELNDAYRGTALLLGDVVEADDAYTSAHCKDVVRLALAVARELGVDLEDQRTVEFAGLLHDIGKIAVPKEIINKPGALDPAEWEIIKTHTVEGQRMLDRVGGFMGKVGYVVRSHHERWDGRGYPDGLCGEEIPLAARIISCCDAFNAMTTTRPYRKAMPTAAAVEELREHAGGQFEPRVVEALIAVMGEPAVLAAPTPPPSLGAGS
jgi:putative nucleotidyltransferase with HDIG domain